MEAMDNPAPESAGTTATQPETTSFAPAQTTPAVQEFQWKSQLAPDFANSPTIKKFSDDKSGFNEAVKSHLSLEQLLGHEKVPLPKGEDDKEGWNRLSKALGVPDKADQYGLPDAEIPPDMAGLSFNKQEFSEIVHSLKLTPGQAKQLWQTYTTKGKEYYAKHLNSVKEQMTQVVNRMRSEWGDAYETKVEMGQMVISKFAPDQDTQDFLTSQLVKDPRGIKFLAKVGEQFAENKIGDFAMKTFSLAPDQAQSEIDKIVGDMKHPYNNDRAPQKERERAIDYVNSLYAAIERAKR
jgi:hypothetical protein